jgi:hypothetical protein
MLIAAVRTPVAPGLKVTSKLHSPDAARVAVQLLLLIVKSDAFAPDAAMAEMPVTVDAELLNS